MFCGIKGEKFLCKKKDAGFTHNDKLITYFPDYENPNEKPTPAPVPPTPIPDPTPTPQPPQTPTNPIVVNPSNFFKKYAGSWYSKSNSASVNGKGMFNSVITVIAEATEGITFEISGRCEYYAQPNESLLSDFTSNNNGSSLFVDQAGNVFLKCDGQKLPAGQMTDDTLNLSLGNCPNTGASKSLRLNPVQDGVQINYSGRNFDGKSILCDSVVKKLP